MKNVQRTTNDKKHAISNHPKFYINEENKLRIDNGEDCKGIFFHTIEDAVRFISEQKIKIPRNNDSKIR